MCKVVLKCTPHLIKFQPSHWVNSSMVATSRKMVQEGLVRIWIAEGLFLIKVLLPPIQKVLARNLQVRPAKIWHILRKRSRFLQDLASLWPFLLHICKIMGLARILYVQDSCRTHNLAKMQEKWPQACKILQESWTLLQDVSDLGRPDLQGSCKNLLYGQYQRCPALREAHDICMVGQ